MLLKVGKITSLNYLLKYSFTLNIYVFCLFCKTHGLVLVAHKHTRLSQFLGHTLKLILLKSKAFVFCFFWRWLWSLVIAWMVDHVCQIVNFLQAVEGTYVSACPAFRAVSVKWMSLSAMRTPVAWADVLVDFLIILVYVRLNSRVSFGSSWMKLVWEQIRKESSLAFQIIHRLLKQVYGPKDFNIHLKSLVKVITKSFTTRVILLLYIAYIYSLFCPFL